MKPMHWLLVLLLTLSLWPVSATPALAQNTSPRFLLENCRYGAFSTEEDFMMTKESPYDGNPYISDGDLLSLDGKLCARNADLLRAFDVTIDLGLDAVDIIDIGKRIVAFSTELDSPYGNFTAGDLLITPKTVIPNAALVVMFKIRHNIGLDGIQLIGEPRALLAFAEKASTIPRDQWVNDTLQKLLKDYQVDIWFTVEGSWSPGEKYPTILDGDLLSARDGKVVITQADLLAMSTPAGIPKNGVDFGLDAIALSRTGDLKSIRFSTEILFRAREKSFTDGDVLTLGGTVERDNGALIAPFAPATNFLGLDALWLSEEIAREPNIQTMCGDDRLVDDFDGGVVFPGEAGAGLYTENVADQPTAQLHRPCGEFVPIGGYLPEENIKRFRVAYRKIGTTLPPAGTAEGIRTTWQLKEQRFTALGHAVCLYTNKTLSTDTSGWLDAAAYRGARDGSLTGCVHDELRLAVWDTNHTGLAPADKDGHYVLWLEWEDGVGTLHKEAYEHHLQLDNTLPKLADSPAGLQIYRTDGTTPVPACGKATGASEFQVWGQFEDAHYWQFWLTLSGGSPPTWKQYGPHNYYDPDDGTVGVKNTDDTGTKPDGKTVYLRNMNMTELGKSFTDCCYQLELWVRDTTIRHSFNQRVVNDVSGSPAWFAHSLIAFGAAP